MLLGVREKFVPWCLKILELNLGGSGLELHSEQLSADRGPLSKR